MSRLKGTEKFVAESLQSYFEKISDNVSFEDGGDPPDIYLKIDNRKISVEITDLDQNVLKDRKTIDYGYLKYIDNLDKEFRHLINDNKKILLFFHHDYTKVSTISKKFKKYLNSLIDADELKIGNSIEDYINTVSFKISILPMPKSGTRKIAGSAMPFGGKVKKSRDINTVLDAMSDFHLSGQTYNIVNNRIQDKTVKCKDIKRPIWLALFDNYYNKFTYFDSKEHIEHYKDTFKDIENFGIFDKILIIFENGDVLEFDTHNKNEETNNLP